MPVNVLLGVTFEIAESYTEHMSFITPQQFVSLCVQEINNHPGDLLSQKIDEATANTLAHIVEVCFQVSLKQEEGRRITGSLIFDLANQRHSSFGSFDPPRSFTESELARFMPSVDAGVGVIALGLVRNEVKIFGIRNEVLQEDAQPPQHLSKRFNVFIKDQLSIRIERPGTIVVSCGSLVLEYESGKARARVPLMLSKELVDYAKALTDSESEAWQLFLRYVVNLIRNVLLAQHGGCVLLDAHNTDRVDSKVNLKYRLTVASPITDIIKLAQLRANLYLTNKKKSKTLDSEDISKMSWQELLLERKIAHHHRILSGLANVDGCVVLNQKFDVKGYGGRVAIDEKPVDEITAYFDAFQYFSRQPATTSIKQFGLRHLAAYKYCESKNHRIAFVVSQDGDFRMFRNDGSSVTCYACFDVGFFGTGRN